MDHGCRSPGTHHAAPLPPSSLWDLLCGSEWCYSLLGDDARICDLRMGPTSFNFADDGGDFLISGEPVVHDLTWQIMTLRIRSSGKDYAR